MPENRPRAAAYSRVSTEEEKQLNALEKQRKENRDIIQKKGWVLVREYVDEGKSGTQIKKRDGYLKLFEDLEKDEFDIVVIKDQDRLMRNPKDWYIFTDRLLKNNKKLYIYLDQTFYNPDNSLITGIKAILAEEYSRHLSRKINNAHKNRQESGDAVIVTNRTWGYRNIAGRIEIDEEERAVIEQIFTMYANGMGSRLICKELSRRGIRNRKGNTLAESQIRSIVRNPLYKGTAVMNRTHINFDTKLREKVAKEEWIYHENAVPPIVSSRLWSAANEQIDSNRKIQDYGGGEGSGNKDKKAGQPIEEGMQTRSRITGLKTGSHLLSRKLKCGECGQSFWRNKRSTKNIYWYCSEYYRNGRKENGTGCSSLRLKEEEIYAILAELGDSFLSREEKQQLLQRILNKIIRILEGEEPANNKQKLLAEESDLKSKKEKLLELYLDGLLTKQDYQKRTEDIALRLRQTEARINDAKTAEKPHADIEKRKKEINDFLKHNTFCNPAIPFIASHTTDMIISADKIQIQLDLDTPLTTYTFTQAISQHKREFHLSK